MSLSEDGVRQLLRECVTVVKPGETLIVRAGRDWTASQVHEVQDLLDYMTEHRELGFRVLMVPGDELGVTDSSDEAFAERVMNAVNALFVKADSAGYVHARPQPAVAS